MSGSQHKIVGAGFGIAGAMIVMVEGGDPNGALIALTAIGGAMLPDIDHDRTKIGRKRNFVTNLLNNITNTVGMVLIIGAMVMAFLMFKGMVDFGVDMRKIAIAGIGGLVFLILKKIITNSKSFKWATKHRGLMHTLLVPALLVLAMTATEFPVWKYGVLGLNIGYLSHLFADMLTVEGCPVLFPLSTKNKRFPTKFQTKDKVCDVAAKVVAFLAIAIGCIVCYVL